MATVFGLTLFLPRYQRAESATPAASPANCSRRRFEVWTILTVMLAIRMVRLDALVWNTGAVGTWVLSLNRRAASAPWTWTVSPLFRAMASTTSRTSGTTAPTKRLVRGRDEDAAGKTLDFAPAGEARQRPVDGAARAVLQKALAREGLPLRHLAYAGSNSSCGGHVLTFLV